MEKSGKINLHVGFPHLCWLTGGGYVYYIFCQPTKMWKTHVESLGTDRLITNGGFSWIFHIFVSLQEGTLWMKHVHCTLQKWGWENQRRGREERVVGFIKMNGDISPLPVGRTAEKNSWMQWATTNLCMAVSVMCSSVRKKRMNESDPN